MTHYRSMRKHVVPLLILIIHDNSSYEATVSQRIRERVIEFGMDDSLLGLAIVNKVASAACEPALKCLKLVLKYRAANIALPVFKKCAQAYQQVKYQWFEYWKEWALWDRDRLFWTMNGGGPFWSS